jgi:hypothetical protein
MRTNFLAIIAEGVDSTQRRQIQAVVKANSPDWWHEMANVWIVEGGGTVADWYRRLEVVFGGNDANLLILSLPDARRRGFAALLPERAVSWLTDSFNRDRKSISPVERREIAE